MIVIVSAFPPPGHDPTKERPLPQELLLDFLQQTAGLDCDAAYERHGILDASVTKWAWFET